MFTVTIKHRGDASPTEYSVYEKEEMDEQGKEYIYWKEARVGDWALSDDGFCAKVIKRTKYPNDRGLILYIFVCLGVILCGIQSTLPQSLMLKGGLLLILLREILIYQGQKSRRR